MEKALVDAHLPAYKFDAKGGWTYVVIPDIPAEKKAPGGLLRVRGTIDHYSIRQFNLLPMKDGGMMLPLNAQVRKSIRKKAGDTVHVVLYPDNSAVDIPEDIEVCLLESDSAHRFFMSLSDSNKKYYIDWIESAQRSETKVNRICQMLERLEKGQKFYDWPLKAD